MQCWSITRILVASVSLTISAVSSSRTTHVLLIFMKTWRPIWPKPQEVPCVFMRGWRDGASLACGFLSRRWSFFCSCDRLSMSKHSSQRREASIICMYARRLTPPPSRLPFLLPVTQSRRSESVVVTRTGGSRSRSRGPSQAPRDIGLKDESQRKKAEKIMRSTRKVYMSS